MVDFETPVNSAALRASKTTETIKAIEKAFSKKGLKLHDSLPLCQVKAQSYFLDADYKGVIESTSTPPIAPNTLSKSVGSLPGTATVMSS